MSGTRKWAAFECSLTSLKAGCWILGCGCSVGGRNCRTRSIHVAGDPDGQSTTGACLLCLLRDSDWVKDWRRVQIVFWIGAHMPLHSKIPHHIKESLYLCRSQWAAWCRLVDWRVHTAKYTCSRPFKIGSLTIYRANTGSRSRSLKKRRSVNSISLLMRSMPQI